MACVSAQDAACREDANGMTIRRPVDRRRFNKAVIGSLFGVPALLDWERADATLQGDRRPDAELLGQVELLVSAITTTTTRQLDKGSPELLAPMLQGVLTFVQSLGGAHESPLLLSNATARLALLYGWLSFQMDNKSEARRSYRFAVDRARAAGLTEVHATILAAASQLDSTMPYGGYGSSSVSLVTLDHAYELLDTTSAPVLRAWILSRRAQEWAALGDAARAEMDLAVAVNQFQPAEVTAETFYAYSRPGWVIGYEASCNRLGGRWTEAEAAYGRVLTHPSSPLWRSVTMSSLASVQASQGDPGQAVGTLRQAVGLAIETNTPLRLRHIYGARAQLDPFRDTPTVQEFDHFLSVVAQV
jgi:hypothetical protein